MHMTRSFPIGLATLVLAWSALLAVTSLRAEGIGITEVQRDGEVDFEKEVLPILRRKCLACHNNTDAESDLVLETPQAILKGGSSGEAVVPGKGLESLLLKVGSKQEEPFMPPEDNDVGAKPLTPEELGLIKLWVDQGAKGNVGGAAENLQWQPLPPGVNPVYAIAVSPDGQFAAAGRANQVFIYHVPSKREVGRLTDPALLDSGVYDKPGVAHLDLVQSLRFSPDNQLLVSGGYRNVKFWRRDRNARKLELGGVEASPTAAAISSDGLWSAIGQRDGKIALYDLNAGERKHVLEGHTGAVKGLAFTADNAKLVSGSDDKTFRLWQVADAQMIASVETPSGVNAIALMAEASQVATGGADHIIRLWTLPEKTEPAADSQEQPPAPPTAIKELKGHGGPVTSLAAISAAQLLSGSEDATLRVWDVNGGNEVRQFNHGGPVTAVAARADGQRFASASSSNSAKLWDANGKQLAEMRGDFRAQIHVEDANRIVAIAKRVIEANKADLKAATDRKAAEEKNAQAAEEARKKAEEEHNKKIEEAKQPIADKLAGEKTVADAKTAQTQAESDKQAAEEAMAKADVAIQEARTRLAQADKYINDSATAAKTVSETLAASLTQVQEAAKVQADNKALADLSAAVAKAVADATESQKQAAEAAKLAAQQAIAEGETMKKAAEQAKAQAEQGIAKALNDIKAAEENLKKLAEAEQKAIDARTATEKALQSATRTMERAKEAADKATAAIPPVEATVQAAEQQAKTEEERLKQAQQASAASEQPRLAVAFAPDGRTVAVAGNDQIVSTWDAESGVAIETYEGHAATINALAYTPQGDILSVAENNSAFVWDTHTPWKLVRTIGSPNSAESFVDRVTALDFSPDGKLLATGGGEPSRSGELKLWNPEDGSLVREISEPHSDVIYGLEFSPDGKQLATCGSDRFAKVFDVATGEFVRSFEGHTHHVLGVAWRADGRLLATSGADNVIKVWDARTGDQTRTITGFNKEVTAVRFLAEGDNVVASSGDNAVRMKNTGNGGNVRDFGGAGDFMYSVGVSANGKVIVAGGQDSIVRMWQENGQVLANFDPPKPGE